MLCLLLNSCYFYRHRLPPPSSSLSRVFSPSPQRNPSPIVSSLSSPRRPVVSFSSFRFLSLRRFCFQGRPSSLPSPSSSSTLVAISSLGSFPLSVFAFPSSSRRASRHYSSSSVVVVVTTMSTRDCFSLLRCRSVRRRRTLLRLLRHLQESRHHPRRDFDVSSSSSPIVSVSLSLSGVARALVRSPVERRRRLLLLLASSSSSSSAEPPFHSASSTTLLLCHHHHHHRRCSS